MTRYTVDLDLTSMWATPQRCPGCGALALHPVADGDQTGFECRGCQQLWRIGLGYATPIDRPEHRHAGVADEMAAELAGEPGRRTT